MTETKSRAFTSEEELANLAFSLLTSNTLDRYVRLTKQAASKSKLIRRVEQDPKIVAVAIARARVLWHDLLKSPSRDVPEVELALILGVLAHTAYSSVQKLLTDLSLIERPSTVWIVGLARRLREERPHSTTYYAAVGGLSTTVSRTRFGNQRAINLTVSSNGTEQLAVRSTSAYTLSWDR